MIFSRLEATKLISEVALIGLKNLCVAFGCPHTYSSQTSPLLKQKQLCPLPFAKGKTSGSRFLKICFRKGAAAFFKPF